jgi:hypothetical protein
MKYILLFLLYPMMAAQLNAQFIQGIGTSDVHQLGVVSVAPPAVGTVRYTQDFESGAGFFPYFGWSSSSTAVDGGFKIGDSIRSNLGVNWKIPLSGRFAYTHDDSCNCNKINEELGNSAVNLSAGTFLYFDADIYFRPYDKKEKAWIRRGTQTDTIAPSIHPRHVVYPAHMLDGVASASVAFGYSDGGIWGSGLALDNLRFYEAAHQRDAAITRFRINGSAPENYYRQIPQQHAAATPLRITAEIANRGRQPVAQAHVEVEWAGRARGNATSQGDTLYPGEMRWDTATYYLPTEGKGNYRMSITAVGDGIDEYTVDDTLKWEFMVTDSVYRKQGDETPHEGYWFGPGVAYRLTSEFELAGPDTATSISIWIDRHTKTGASIELLLLDEFFQNKIPAVFPDSFYKKVKIRAQDKGRWNTWRIPSTGLSAGKYRVGYRAISDSVFVGVGDQITEIATARANLGQGWGAIERIPFIGINLRGEICQPRQISFTSTPASCGVADGVLLWQTTGGSAPYQYFLRDFGAVTDSITGLKAGVYHLTSIDNRGCYTDTLLSLGDSGSPFIQLVSLKGETCFGDANGEIIVTASGAGAISYYWSNGSTDSSLTSIRAGNYSIVAIDATFPNCTSVAAIELPGPREPFAIQRQIEGLKCYYDSLGSISLVPGGGTPPYSFQWRPSGLPSEAAQNHLRRGIYSIVITDANMCVYHDTVELSTPDTIKSNARVIDSLGAGQIITAVSGGVAPYSFSWAGPGGYKNPGTPDIDNLIVQGQYQLTITDSIGCALIENFDVGGIVGVPDKGTTKFEVYPNPFHQKIVVKGIVPDTEFSLTDIFGRTLTTGHLHKEILDFAYLPAGTYFLLFKGVGAVKLLKE